MTNTKTMRVSELEYNLLTKFRAAHSDKKEAIMDVLHIDHETPKEPGKLYIYKGRGRTPTGPQATTSG